MINAQLVMVASEVLGSSTASADHAELFLCVV